MSFFAPALSISHFSPFRLATSGCIVGSAAASPPPIFISLSAIHNSMFTYQIFTMNTMSRPGTRKGFRSIHVSYVIQYSHTIGPHGTTYTRTLIQTHTSAFKIWCNASTAHTHTHIPHMCMHEVSVCFRTVAYALRPWNSM